MKDTVVIKSFPNGIMLHMDQDADFNNILEELSFKFTEARNFFGNASMALAIEGRTLSPAEEILVLETIRNSSSVNVVCIVGKDETTNKKFIKALQQVEKKLSGGDDGQFYKGTLKNREILETESSIVILGDVYPGSAVISAKNIIVLGGLYGEAYAGGNGQGNAYVVALEMEPERLKVGDFKYKANTKQSKWGIRLKVQPKIAYVRNRKIVFEPLTKDLLDSI
nr:septum site-determining protein MinC [uncultured Acetatifactor sp.]